MRSISGITGRYGIRADFGSRGGGMDPAAIHLCANNLQLAITEAAINQVASIQGFDHLPSYPPAAAETFNQMIDHYSLMPDWIVINNATGCVGSVTVEGVTYQGLVFGSNGRTDFGLKKRYQYADPRYQGKRLHLGVRISAADSVANRNVAMMTSSNSAYGAIKSPAAGGPFSMYVEAVFDFVTRSGEIFQDGVAIESMTSPSNDISWLLADSPSLARNYANKNGIVYSDFVVAIEESSSGYSDPWVNVVVASCPVVGFTGDAGFYNSTGGDIVSGLNTYFNSAYKDDGNFLHVPSTAGAIAYGQPLHTPPAGNVAAVQAQSLITADAPQYGLVQDISSSGDIQRDDENEEFMSTTSLISHISVVNPTSPIAVSQSTGMIVQIHAETITYESH